MPWVKMKLQDHMNSGLNVKAYLYCMIGYKVKQSFTFNRKIYINNKGSNCAQIGL